MLEQLRAEVLEANLELVRRGLVLYTFGNASAVSRQDGLIAIKPSGVPYEKMTPADMVITDLNGRIVEGNLRPSSDLPTHAALYRAFPEIGGVVHTHSRHATAWAQAAREIPCFGTTHADYFEGPVPVTALLTREEIETEYELNTGVAIIRRMEGLHPLAYPGILVAGHAPFCWGETVTKGRAQRRGRGRTRRHGLANADHQPASPAHLDVFASQASLPQARPPSLLRPKIGPHVSVRFLPVVPSPA